MPVHWSVAAFQLSFLGSFFLFHSTGTLKSVFRPVHLEFLRNDLEFYQTSGMHASLPCYQHSFSIVFMIWKPTDSLKDRISCPPFYVQREVTFKQRILGKSFKSTEQGKKNHDALCLHRCVYHQIIVVLQL